MMQIPEINGHPEAVTVAHQAEQLLAVAQSYQIDDDEMFAVAGDELRGIVTKRAEITEMRMSITRPMDEAKKRVIDFFRAPLEKLEQAEGVIKASMSVYDQKRRALIEQQQREAQARAEAERRERDRQDAERRQKEAEVRAEAERLELRAAEAMRNAIEAGDQQSRDNALAEAEAIQQQAAELHQVAQQPVLPIEPDPAATLPAPVIDAPQAAGVSFRTKWKARVTDKAAFIRAAAGRPDLEAMLDINDSALNRFASVTSGQASVPGVLFHEERIAAARRK